MIKLRYIRPDETDENFRYVTALMIEARVRGYPLMVNSAMDLSGACNFSVYMNRLIDWLVTSYPDEFQLD